MKAKKFFDAFKDDGLKVAQAKPQTLIEEMLAALTLAEPTLIARSPFSTALPAVRKAIARAKVEASEEVDTFEISPRLIATAPELLETLKKLVECSEFSACYDENNPSLWVECIKERNIIAKAEGE